MLNLLQARLHDSGGGLHFEASHQSYAEIVECASRQAGQLSIGSTVVLVAENSLDLVQALLAAWWAGCTPVCLPPPARLQQAGPYDDFLRSALDYCGAEGGWCDARLQNRLPGKWRSLPIPAGESASAPGQPAEVAYIQFSSGTTLEPKATHLSHANLRHNLEAIVSQLPGDRSAHSCVSWLPLYHDMGLVGCLLSALYAPGPLTLLTPLQFALRPDNWLKTISDRRASISVAPNFALEQLLQRGSDLQLDLSCLQKLLLGSETIRPDTLREFYAKYRERGLAWEALTPVYGLAEATLAVTFSQGPRLASFQIPHQIGERVHPGERELVSLGRPVQGVELSLRNDQGQELPDGHLGHIHIAGPNLALGLPSPYNTGDLGFLWEEELFFVTRHKDVLVHHGRKHDPEVVEQLLHPLESAAVQGEEVICLIERPRRGPQPDPIELQQKLSLAPLPVRAQLVDSGWLPRTSSGKISRFRARQKHVAL